MPQPELYGANLRGDTHTDAAGFKSPGSCSRHLCPRHVACVDCSTFNDQAFGQPAPHAYALDRIAIHVCKMWPGCEEDVCMWAQDRLIVRVTRRVDRIREGVIVEAALHDWTVPLSKKADQACCLGLIDNDSHLEHVQPWI